MACLALAFGAGAAQAQEKQGDPIPPTDPRGGLTIQLENDVFADTDRYYTNGTLISWMSASSPPEFFGPAQGLGGFFFPREGQWRWGLGLGQNIYTPADTQAHRPDPRDRPYAGWLYVSTSLISYTERELDTVELQVGVVGPAALARQVQNGFHTLIGDDHAKGWHYQLKNEPGVNLVFDRKWRAQTLLAPGSNLGLDATPNVTVSLGSVSTYAAAGATLRFGQNLSADFGAPRIRPALAGSNFFDASEGFGWYLFGGIQGRVVARDEFLDGSAFRGHSPDVDKKIGVADFSGGLALMIGATRLTYTYVVRTKEFDGQKGMSKFGSVALTFAL